MRYALVVLAACSFDHGVEGTSDANLSDGHPRDDGLVGVDSAIVDSANGLPSCTDGMKNGDELDVDCGGTACGPCADIFTTDGNTLALFELNGTLADSSGNNRNATLIGGTFVSTSWGQGFSVPGQSTQGFQWNTYAGMITHPYTVEMVVTPQSVSCWKKLFGPSDSADAGWYFCGGFSSYPSNAIGPTFTTNQRHYIAIVSTSSNGIRVYADGASIGTSNNFTAPGGAAIFFRDDTNTSRSEALDGVVDAVRISKVARTATEIQAVQAKLAAQP